MVAGPVPKYAGAKDVFWSRGLRRAMEGSLKMKEISYIHSEAYAAGELKYGTISLIEPGTLVVSIATGRAVREDDQQHGRGQRAAADT